MRFASILAILSLGLAGTAPAQAPEQGAAQRVKEVKAAEARTWLDAWMYCLDTEALRAAATFPTTVPLADLVDHSFDLCKTSEATMEKTDEAANASYFPSLAAYRADHAKWKGKVRATLLKEVAVMRSDPAGYAAEVAARNVQEAARAAQDARFQAAAIVLEDCLRKNMTSGLTAQAYAALPAASLNARLESSFATCSKAEAAVVATVTTDPLKRLQVVDSLRTQARAAIRK